jgi:hypothetical protein
MYAYTRNARNTRNTRTCPQYPQCPHIPACMHIPAIPPTPAYTAMPTNTRNSWSGASGGQTSAKLPVCLGPQSRHTFVIESSYLRGLRKPSGLFGRLRWCFAMLRRQPPPTDFQVLLLRRGGVGPPSV